jgi:hypothetical protein
MAVGGLGGLATSAQAHTFGHEHWGYERGYCFPYFYGCYDDDCGYWYWHNGCRFWHAPRHFR